MLKSVFAIPLVKKRKKNKTMKKLIIVFFLITSISSYAQFFTDFGIGYGIQLQKTKKTDTNPIFYKSGNIFSGIQYQFSMGYQFNEHWLLSIDNNFKPRNFDFNNLMYDQENSTNYFFSGAYFSSSIRTGYKLKINPHLIMIPQFGISFYTLNLYSQSFTNNTTVNPLQKNIYIDELYFKLKKIEYHFNYMINLNYKISKNFEALFNLNINSNFKVENDRKFKVIHRKSIYKIDYTDPTKPDYLEVNEVSNVNEGISFNNGELFYSREVENQNSLDKIMNIQIGLRYTFGKKE